MPRQCYAETSPRGTPPPPRVEVPAEIDLHLDDPIASESQHLGIAKATAVGPRRLVGDDHLVARLDRPHEVEVAQIPGVGTAPLEVALAAQLRVGRAVEDEVGCEKTLADLALPRRERPVGGVGELGAAWRGGAAARPR